MLANAPHAVLISHLLASDVSELFFDPPNFSIPILMGMLPVGCYQLCCLDTGQAEAEGVSMTSFICLSFSKTSWTKILSQGVL